MAFTVNSLLTDTLLFKVDTCIRQTPGDCPFPAIFQSLLQLNCL